MEIIGHKCAAYYKGEWRTGTIVKHNVKDGNCIIETNGRYGTIKVTIYQIRLTDKEDY